MRWATSDTTRPKRERMRICWSEIASSFRSPAGAFREVTKCGELPRAWIAASFRSYADRAFEEDPWPNTTARAMTTQSPRRSTPPRSRSWASATSSTNSNGWRACFTPNPETPARTSVTAAPAARIASSAATARVAITARTACVASSAATAPTAPTARAATDQPTAFNPKTAPTAPICCCRKTFRSATIASGASACRKRTSTSSMWASPGPSTSKSSAGFERSSACAEVARESHLSPMVKIPEGVFLRGSPEDVGLFDERPQRQVLLSAFEIDLLPVTFGDFAAFIDAGGYDRRAFWTEAGWGAREREGWSRPRFMREPEWSHVGGDAQPVGSYPEGKSPYGVLDMAGGVWEWCADWYGAEYYAIAQERDPPGPASGQLKVARGGAWSALPLQNRTANRNAWPPGARFSNLGFRCAR